MRLSVLCKKVLEMIENNPDTDWAGHIVVPCAGTYGAQDFIDEGIPVELENNDVIVGR